MVKITTVSAAVRYCDCDYCCLCLEHIVRATRIQSQLCIYVYIILYMCVWICMMYTCSSKRTDKRDLHPIFFSQGDRHSAWFWHVVFHCIVPSTGLRTQIPVLVECVKIYYASRFRSPAGYDIIIILICLKLLINTTSKGWIYRKQ